ncbi:hypothetical protein, conserved [Trypanosoma brucei gambiense DAL972]|uniref:Uncharacterized protein n=1 Tax=Trypanosoma brucei gambiense (strain MHOM/CI/86/DAL972) TaxID=679716 RepID=C9ZME3_TRYB9|nr:hypothetical protein, conserved [Trypanosoma brucei gambiense DAL972]CBH10816.1 hypothetical protein, conserved [Trypanosoma brucei gambiense DAL972]|eukprot:XP_011773104.1 hypothetical protein, conserved [Trypanosoma brucei gambiense DAL972]
MKSRGFTRQPSDSHDGVSGSSPYFARWGVYDAHEDKSHFSSHDDRRSSSGNINDSYGSRYVRNNNSNDEEPNRWWQSSEDDMTSRSSALNIHVREKQWRSSTNHWAPMQRLVPGVGVAKQTHQMVNTLFMGDGGDEDGDVGDRIDGDTVVVDDDVIYGSNIGDINGANNSKEGDGESRQNWLDYCYHYNCQNNNSYTYNGDNSSNGNNYNRNDRHNGQSYGVYSALSRLMVTGNGEAEERRDGRKRSPATTPIMAGTGGELTQPCRVASSGGAPLVSSGTAVYTANRVRYSNGRGTDSVYTSNTYSITVGDGSINATNKNTVFVGQAPTASAGTSSTPASTAGFEAAAASIIAAAGLPLGTFSLANYIVEGQPRFPSMELRRQQQQTVFDQNKHETILGEYPVSVASPPSYCEGPRSNGPVLNTAHFLNTATTDVHTSAWSGHTRDNQRNLLTTTNQHAQQQQAKAYSEYLSDLLYFHADFFPPPPPPRGLSFPSYSHFFTKLSLPPAYSLPRTLSLVASNCRRRAALWYHYANKWNITRRLPPPPRTPLPEMMEEEEESRRLRQLQHPQWSHKGNGTLGHHNQQSPPRTPYDISEWMKMCERWFDVAQRQFEYPPENVPTRVPPSLILRHVVQY